MRLLSYYLIVIFLVFISCEKNTIHVENDIPNVCETTGEATNYFFEDAYFLTINQIFNDSCVAFCEYKDSVLLPPELYDDILRRIGKIYELENSLEKDSIIDILGIHQFKLFKSKEIFMSVASNEWSDNLVNGVIPTGNTFFDALYQKYKFSFEGYREALSRHNFNLKIGSIENLNLIFLAKKLDELDGVVISSPNWSGGDGDNIDMLIDENNNFIFKFGRRWGDCLSGCISERVWEFKVTEDCEVEFLESYGDIIND